MDSTRANKEPQSSETPFARLLELPRGQTVALLHSGPNGRATLFSEPIAELRLAPEQWSGAFGALDEFLTEHEGRKCVGFLGYDLRDDVEALPRALADDLSWPCLHVACFRDEEEWWPDTVPTPPTANHAPPGPAATSTATTRPSIAPPYLRRIR